MSVRFSIFDWLDETGRDLGDSYAERLQLVECADRLGFYAYHLAEHHGSELSTVPSPNLFLSAVAQRTRRLRLGPLGYVIPTYNPLRLLEEICMLDQMSGGRLEVGLSRGSSPSEVDFFGVHKDDARPMFLEAVEIIRTGLATGRIDWHGKYFSFDNLTTRLRPKQQPCPPLWYPTSNVESIPWVAAQGFNTVFAVHLAPSFQDIVDMLGTYRGEYARAHGQPAQTNYGFSLHVHVAETDEQALTQARPAFAHFMHNFTHRYVVRNEPDRLARYADRMDFEGELARGRLLVGSPATVRDQLGGYLRASGANYFLGAFFFGSLTLEQATRSLELFAREVMPALEHRLSSE
jgi:alkanesulfonate monooxygenase SsuD/methylene tetrahydromethanopterin reductase-like flavin-dependent oxidoreductase (luciferase family)